MAVSPSSPIRSMATGNCCSLYVAGSAFPADRRAKRSPKSLKIISSAKFMTLPDKLHCKAFEQIQSRMHLAWLILSYYLRRFLCLFFLRRFFRLWVAILWRFLFFPQGIILTCLKIYCYLVSDSILEMYSSTCLFNDVSVAKVLYFFR